MDTSIVTIVVFFIILIAALFFVANRYFTPHSSNLDTLIKDIQDEKKVLIDKLEESKVFP
jgi:uncharacterized membrane protein YvbJ|tara:strand:+ start:538 stop:717 length:180 start_codon:yes stop_codon:yes gene_type:complete